mmetsp:Transcript_32538/g.37902  ORF Transcript_32538/g.37902 Transcript_32538/m.37902 type:complete len:438 (+) Transcript_32538:217-1530(+)
MWVHRTILLLSQTITFVLAFQLGHQSYPYPRHSLAHHDTKSSLLKISSTSIDLEDSSQEEEKEYSSCSKLRSLTFVQLTKATSPQLLSDYLMELGASSVSITDHDKDGPLENAIYAEPDANNESWAAIICGDAAVGKNIWMRCDVTAHFADSFDLLGIVDEVRTTLELASGIRYVVDDVPDLDWVKEVQSNWKPFVAGGFLLKFPWHTQDDVKDAIKLHNTLQVEEDQKTKMEDEYYQLLLEGGVAFGTGEHPTTQLCLSWITQLFKEDNGIKMFLDYGAGSGVLGIAACVLNDSLQAVGVEIDVDAIRIADVNAENNGMNMKSYLPRNIGSDDESASLIMKAMKRAKVDILPETMDGQYFDACAANILAGPLVSLCSTIASMVRSGGEIGLSGILEWQSEDVLEAYSEFFDDVKVADSKEGWILITGSRNQKPVKI